MSRSRLTAVMAAVALVFCSCSGDDGAVGPQGPAGNANVVVINFGSETTTSGSINYLFEATPELVDDSMVLAYANPSNQAPTAWYPVPGLGSNGQYMTRSFFWQTTPDPSEYTYAVRLVSTDGTSTYTNSVTFTKFKIVLAPASQVMQLSATGALDVSDYDAVRDHFRLED